MLINPLKQVYSASFLVCLLLLSGCASTVKVTGNIPEPLTPRLPLTGQLALDDEFRRYNYEEKENGRALKSIEFGEAQVLLFEKIFGHLLTLTSEPEPFDLRIEPQLLDFEYSTPRETKLNLYEVFLKYRVKISDSSNAEVADWLLKGYGKTPTALLTSADKAFNSATNVALRDVGAQLLIGFAKQDSIRGLLDSKQQDLESVTESSVPDEAVD